MNSSLRPPHPRDTPFPAPWNAMSPMRKVATTARTLYAETDVDGILHRALLLAVEFIPGADDAGASMLHAGGTVETPAATSERAAHVDRLQYENGDGPCITALRESEVVSVPDLQTNDTWGSWGPRTAAETGTRSMLCFRLFTNDEVLGALNLYADQPQAFTSDDVEQGQAFAAQYAVHLARARSVEHFGAALESREHIGQAIGMLMERYDMNSERAFEVLTRLSQNSNRKLRDIARELVETRQLPLDPTGR